MFNVNQQFYIIIQLPSWPWGELIFHGNIQGNIYNFYMHKQKHELFILIRGTRQPRLTRQANANAERETSTLTNLDDGVDKREEGGTHQHASDAGPAVQVA